MKVHIPENALAAITRRSFTTTPETLACKAPLAQIHPARIASVSFHANNISSSRMNDTATLSKLTGDRGTPLKVTFVIPPSGFL